MLPGLRPLPVAGHAGIGERHRSGRRLLPSVRPRPSSRRAAPRSTVSVPVHSLAHQFVEALPSTALLAGAPDAAVDALAVPVGAMSSAVAFGASEAADALPAGAAALLRVSVSTESPKTGHESDDACGLQPHETVQMIAHDVSPPVNRADTGLHVPPAAPAETAAERRHPALRGFVRDLGVGARSDVLVAPEHVRRVGLVLQRDEPLVRLLAVTPTRRVRISRKLTYARPVDDPAAAGSPRGPTFLRAVGRGLARGRHRIEQERHRPLGERSRRVGDRPTAPPIW